MERIQYNGELPASFFTIPQSVYATIPFQPNENPVAIQELFRLEAVTNEIIIYTDHASIRLAGIFPHQKKEAYFGFWESAPDTALAEETFALLKADAHEKDSTLLIGPLNFNTYHHYRLRLGAPPSWHIFDREPVNPVYYPELLQQLGFTVRNTFESRLITKENIPEVYLSKQAFLEELAHIPYNFIPLNPETWQQHEEAIFNLIHAIFSRNPDYTPISLEQFRLLYNQDFARKICPHSSVLFQEKASGRLAAISLCLPDYQKLPEPPTGGPVFARDFANLSKRVLLAKSVGVHPDFRQQGLMSYLAAYAMLSFRELYDEVLFCLMRSDNYSRHFSDNLPYESARYALFQLGLEPKPKP